MTYGEADQVIEQIHKLKVPGMTAFRDHVVPDNPHGYSVRVTMRGAQRVLSTPEQAAAFLDPSTKPTDGWRSEQHEGIPS